MPKIPQKIENSVYKKYILECIEKGMNPTEIERALLDKGIKLTSPTIRKYVEYIRKTGLNVAKFKDEAESTALKINDKLKDIPHLATVFTRRNFLLDDLLKRRNIILEFVTEGKRSHVIFTTINEIRDMLQKNKSSLDSKEYAEILAKLDFLFNYCNHNFLKDSIYPAMEDSIRKYTMDIHELCKYVEQWTSRYEIEAMMEKLTEMITKAAVATFGPLLKKETDEERKRYTEKFIKEVESVVNDLKEQQLKLGDENVK